MTNNVANDVDEVWLSTRVKVKRYRSMELKEDREGIAKFLRERFLERYITPLRSVQRADINGFQMMACCCLLIEAFTAVREGWCTTEGLSERAFHLFFAREDRFKHFRGLERDFWKSVRCGILHQGETGNGWRLNFTDATAPLFEPTSKRINCVKFLDELEAVLNEHFESLKGIPWKYEQWRNVRKKMAATIKDCES